MDYEEPEFMDFDADKWNPKSLQTTGNWTVANQNCNYTTITFSCISRMPNPSSKGTKHITHKKGNNKEGPTSSTNKDRNKTKTETEHNQVKVNNGTLRIIIRWRQTKYNKLLADNTLWNFEATDVEHFIVGTATGAVLYPWKTAPGEAPALPFIDLTPDHLPDDIGLQMLPTSPTKTSIFSFWLCLTTGPRIWLKDPNTK
jgi:hypothetical protein